MTGPTISWSHGREMHLRSGKGVGAGRRFNVRGSNATSSEEIDYTRAAAALAPERVDRHALDVAGTADRDDHVLFGDQVLDVEGALVRLDLRAPGIAVLLLDLQDLTLDPYLGEQARS